MTLQEAAIVETYTGIVMCAGDKRKYVYDYASSLIGRPIYTHEFATMADKLKELSKPDFIEICRKLTDGEVANITRTLLSGGKYGGLK